MLGGVLPEISTLFVSVGFSLIASSCCILQLIVSYFGMSCLGVVKVLKPYQTILSCAVLSWWILKLLLCCNPRRLIVPVAVSMLMLSSPWYIDIQLGDVEVEMNPKENFSSIQVQIVGMGCKACALSAKRALESLEHISSCSVDETKGVAKCKLRGIIKTDSVVKQAIEKAGHRYVGSAISLLEENEFGTQ